MRNPDKIYLSLFIYISIHPNFKFIFSFVPELEPDECSAGGLPAWSMAGLAEVLLDVLVLPSAVLLKKECWRA